jgi:carbonic anhydrase/acetyltransferase-like protein (isoleucine patch superfamily)
MIIEHRGKQPVIHESAFVAPNATICGDVMIGANTSVLFGAVITAAGGPVKIGANCVVMENAVIRGTPKYPTTIGDNVLVGPHAHLTGCTVEDNAFLATGCSIFTAARIGTGAEVRINGVVHLKTVLLPNETVPIGWVAVGDPAQILPPNEHDRIWAIQKPLDFPGTVFGVDRAQPGETFMPEVMARYSRSLGKHHQEDRLIVDWRPTIDE